MLLACAVLPLLACGRCEGRAQDSAVQALGPMRETIEVEPDPELREQGDRLIELAGAVDWDNRYLPAVKVTALLEDKEMMACSGTALSPSLVLTAGHCVCTKKQGTPAVIDGSACFEAAQVETLFYELADEQGAAARASRGTVHSGRVQPHPAMKVVLDAQGRVVSSHADLALITLSRPLEFPGVTLANGEVGMGESIVIVGRGFDEIAGVSGWERRASMNTVGRVATAEDDRVLVEQPEGHRYRQDSGGPCLRQGPNGSALVGISSRWLGEGAAFTIIHPYRDWLRDAVKRGETTIPLRK